MESWDLIYRHSDKGVSRRYKKNSTIYECSEGTNDTYDFELKKSVCDKDSNERIPSEDVEHHSNKDQCSETRKSYGSSDSGSNKQPRRKHKSDNARIHDRLSTSTPFPQDISLAKKNSENNEIEKSGQSMSETSSIRRPDTAQRSKHHIRRSFKQNKEFTYDCLVTRDSEDRRLCDRWMYLIPKHLDLSICKAEFHQQYLSFKKVEGILLAELKNRNMNTRKDSMNEFRPDNKQGNATHINNCNNDGKIEKNIVFSEPEIEDTNVSTAEDEEHATTNIPNEESTYTGTEKEEEEKTEETSEHDAEPEKPTSETDKKHEHREFFRKHLKKSAARRRRARSPRKNQTTTGDRIRSSASSTRPVSTNTSTLSYSDLAADSSRMKEGSVRRLLCELYNDKIYFERLLSSRQRERHNKSAIFLQDEAKNGLEFLYKCADFWNYWNRTFEIENKGRRNVKTADASAGRSGRGNTPWSAHNSSERPKTM